MKDKSVELADKLEKASFNAMRRVIVESGINQSTAADLFEAMDSSGRFYFYNIADEIIKDNSDE
jgi:hypothetical protein